MEIRCSYTECTAKPFSKCSCSDQPQIFCQEHMMDHIEAVNLLHNVELIQILSPEEIKNNRISAFEGVYNSFDLIKSNLIQKVETLFQPKVKIFLDKIESSISEIGDILNYLEDDQNQNFYEKFSSTFEETLSKFEKNSKEIANEINCIEDVAILNKEDAWRLQIGEEEKNSDYRKLASETQPLRLDELYAIAILRFLENFDANILINILINSFFNLTNFCDKENILQYVVKELTENHKTLLYGIILMTRKNENLAQSGSNSISILVKAKYKFDRADLSGIHIPNANLSYGVFYKTNFYDSDLSNCNLSCAQFLNVYVNKNTLLNIKNNEATLSFKIHSLAISHSESWIEVCQRDRITIYDAYNSKKKNECYEESLNFFLQIVSWSYDDNYIASCDWAGNIFIWLWDGFSEFNKLHEKIQVSQGSLTKILWAPNDYRIASWSSNGIVKIWNAITKENIFEIQDALITVFAWSNFGNYAAFYCGNDTIWIYQSLTNQQTLQQTYSDLYSLEWIYNEKYLVFGGKDKSINIWNTKTNEVHSFSNKGESPIKVLKWMDNLSLLAVGDFDGSITIWSVNEHANQTPFFTFHIELFIFCHSNDVSCLSWSEKNNLLVSGSADGTFKVWQIIPKERQGKIGNTEETYSLKESSEEDTDSSNHIFNENLVWCSEATHFIQAKPRENYQEFRLIASELFNNT